MSDPLSDPAHPSNFLHLDGSIDVPGFRRAHGREPTEADQARYTGNGERPDPAEGADGEMPPSARLIVRRTGDVEPEEVRPLFGGRLLIGKIAVVAGNGGIGKSYLTAALAANVTRGWPLPGDPEPFGPADVLVASYEDDTADTLRPRLDKLGADVDRVHAIEGVYDGESPTMQPFGADHISHLSRHLDELPEARLLVVDPVSAWVGGIDEHRNNEVRGALEGLRRLAAARDLAVVIVMHLRKATADNALHRLSGSGAYGQLVRSALLAAPDPDDESKCALAHIKHNVTAQQPTLGYQVDEQGFWWLGERADLDGEQLAGHDRDGERSQKASAEDFLRDVLAEGEVDRNEVAVMAESAGLSWRAVERAKTNVAEHRRDGFGKGAVYYWRLKPDDHAPHHAPHAPQARAPGEHGEHGEHATPSEGGCVACGRPATVRHDLGYPLHSTCADPNDTDDEEPL